MTELKNCKKCNRLFESSGFTETCPTCIEADERDYDLIRSYLLEHPHAKIFEVATNLDIGLNKIKKFLREGRLEIVESTNQFLDCEKCGKPIRSGRYCDDCSISVNHDYKSVLMNRPDSKTAREDKLLQYSNMISYRRNTATR